MYRRFSTVIITLLLSEFKKCWAQQGTSCPASAGYSWAANDMGQDPCVVAHSLFVPQPCNDEYVFFGPLTAGSDDVYPAPSDYTVGTCLCNTVIYSLATACATCQDASFLSWSEWIVNCPASDVVQQSWPTSIPSNTAIPAWAYLPIVNSGWDYTQAYDNATGQTNVASSSPSSSPPPPPSTSQSTIQSTIESASPPSSSPSSNQNSSNSNNNNPSHTATVISQSSSAASTNVPSMSYYTLSGQLTSTFVTSTSSPSNLASPNLTDSIIGGAVGGATGALALTVLGIFFLCRRSRRKSNKSQISSVSDSEGNHDKTKMVVPPNIIIDAHSSTTRLYNPDDPSTFPRDPSTQVLDIGVQGSTYTSGRYMGIPEV